MTRVYPTFNLNKCTCDKKREINYYFLSKGLAKVSDIINKNLRKSIVIYLYRQSHTVVKDKIYINTNNKG